MAVHGCIAPLGMHSCGPAAGAARQLHAHAKHVKTERGRAPAAVVAETGNCVEMDLGAQLKLEGHQMMRGHMPLGPNVATSLCIVSNAQQDLSYLCVWACCPF